MEVDKNDAAVLQKAISEWEQSGALTKEQAAPLREDIVIKRNDTQQIAQYFFFIALFCIILAFGAIFLNEKLLEKIKVYFAWSDLMIALLTAALSALWLWYTGRKRMRTGPIAYETY